LAEFLEETKLRERALQNYRQGDRKKSEKENGEKTSSITEKKRIV